MSRTIGSRDRALKRTGHYTGRQRGATDLKPRRKENYHGRQSMLNAKGQYREFLYDQADRLRDEGYEFKNLLTDWPRSYPPYPPDRRPIYWRRRYLRWLYKQIHMQTDVRRAKRFKGWEYQEDALVQPIYSRRGIEEVNADRSIMNYRISRITAGIIKEMVKEN